MAGRHFGHGRHAGHSVAMFRDKFWWSLALTIPVVVWSADVQHWLGYTAPLFPGSKWIPAVFGTIVFAYAGVVFLRGARGELSERKPGMMTLISLGIIVSFGASLAATFGLFEVEVWWEVGTLITIMILGHWLEMRAVTQAHGALNALAALLPDTAERVDGSEIRTIPVGQLRTGDLVLIRPGARAQALADRAAALLFYVALGAGATTFIYWWLAGDKGHGLIRAATVLIIACPHALGLAIPLVVAISTSLGAQNGLLVKDRLALERARNLDVIVFDKTGTLTRGSPALFGALAAPGVSEEVLFARAAAVETDSEHSLAKVIVAEARRRGLTLPAASGFEALPGRGAQALVDGATVAVGGPRLLSARSAVPSPEIAKTTAGWGSEGKTVLFVIADGGVLGAFAVEDEIRPESKDAIDELHRLGMRVAMITGDSKAVAESVARRIGIDDVAAEVLPADKAAAIERFQAGGKRVAMVGDGVNDAPALATANVGIAIGAGTDVAVESAGIVLVRSDPRDVVGAIELSRAAYRKMVQNLVWATAYNLVAIPVAAGLFLRWGVELPMSVGAIAMSLSTLIVAANAQLLRGLKFGRTESAVLAATVTAGGQP